MILDILPIPRGLVEPIDAAVPDGVTHIGFVATNIHGHVLITEPKRHPYGVSATFSKVRIVEGEKPHETLHRCIREQIGLSPVGIYPIPAVWITPNSRHFYFAGMLNIESDLPSTKIYGLRWCDVDSAKPRIKQSQNADSRQRDLALLSAATSMCLFPPRRILLMLRELHLMGFERLRAPVGIYDMGTWRCPIVPASWTCREHGGILDDAFFHIKELLNLRQFQYSSADEQQPFEWQGVEFAGPRDLARQFLKEQPGIALAGWGPDNQYAIWFQNVLEITAPNGLYYSPGEAELEITTIMTSTKGIPLPPPGYAAKGELREFADQLPQCR